jgi:Ca2+-binding EF-hand superfamily protein
MRSYGKDAAGACRLAKTLQVPVAEMQRWFALFRDYAEPLAQEAEMLRDGRLVREQFAKLVRNNLISDSDILAEQPIQRIMFSIKRVCRAVGVEGDRALSFNEFVECMRALSFDVALSVTPEEYALRSLAKTYSLGPVEVDRYKEMFDELDVNGSGRIQKCELDNILYRCGNIQRDLGLSDARRHSLWLLADPNCDGSIDFEGFLNFNLKYLAPGANGLSQYLARSPKGIRREDRLGHVTSAGEMLSAIADATDDMIRQAVPYPRVPLQSRVRN